MVYDVIDATEMVCRFDDVVHPNRFIRNADGIRFIDIPGLFLCQPATLYVVGVVSKVYLGSVLNTSLDFRVFLPAQAFKKRRKLIADIPPLRQRCISGQAPSLAYKPCSGYLTLHTIVAHRAFRKPMRRSIFLY